jgi:hypothetical protein
MLRVIEDLAGDWRRLDERIEGLSSEIDRHQVVYARVLHAVAGIEEQRGIRLTREPCEAAEGVVHAALVEVGLLSRSQALAARGHISTPSLLGLDHTDQGLPASMYVDILNANELVAAVSKAAGEPDLRRVGTQQTRGGRRHRRNAPPTQTAMAAV